MKSYFILILLILLVQKGFAENALSLKYQDWNEDNDRIRVRSWYAEAGTTLSQNWEMGVVGMVDTITGSTPWGRPPSDQEQWLSSLEEERRAGIINLSTSREDYSFSFEFGLSDESDYLSRSYAANLSRGFAMDTLTLSTGLSYLDDEVDTNLNGYGPGMGIQTRQTPEVFVGIHRILDAQSTVALNLTYSRPKGYLSDPYKQVVRSEPPFPGSTESFYYPYPENRPNMRETWVAYLEGTRLFKELDASLEGSYRYFSDDSDLAGHTVEIQWFQRLGDRFVLRPLLRHYLQEQADFYMLSLDGSGIEPSIQPTGRGSYYSSDYRLSQFEATTYGLKLTYFHRSDLSFDFAYDRYKVKGTDGFTDQRVYPDAGVFTVGFQWGF